MKWFARQGKCKCCKTRLEQITNSLLVLCGPRLRPGCSPVPKHVQEQEVASRSMPLITLQPEWVVSLASGMAPTQSMERPGICHQEVR